MSKLKVLKQDVVLPVVSFSTFCWFTHSLKPTLPGAPTQRETTKPKFKITGFFFFFLIFFLIFFFFLSFSDLCPMRSMVCSSLTYVFSSSESGVSAYGMVQGWERQFVVIASHHCWVLCAWCFESWSFLAFPRVLFAP